VLFLGGRVFPFFFKKSLSFTLVGMQHMDGAHPCVAEDTFAGDKKHINHIICTTRRIFLKGIFQKE
jgi:hypothetical protein